MVSLGTLVSVARPSRKERGELVYLHYYSKLALTPTQNWVKRCFIDNTGEQEVGGRPCCDNTSGSWKASLGPASVVL